MFFPMKQYRLIGCFIYKNQAFYINGRMAAFWATVIAIFQYIYMNLLGSLLSPKLQQIYFF